jgi:hypothetical protein
MLRVLMGLCLACVLMQPVYSAPLPLANSLASEKESAMAFDPVAGRGLVVYAVNGYVYGRYMDANGRPAAASDFGIFPVAFPAPGRSYSTPSVTFKRGQNRFVIAAAETETRIINSADGPISFTLPSGIAVTAFNSDGTRANSRFMRTPIASIARSEKRPVVIADDLDDECCIAVAWEDEAFSRNFYVQRMNATLEPQGAIAQLAAPGAERIANVAATYDLSRDRFTFAYDMVDATSRRWIATTSMLAFTGGTVRHRSIAERVGHGERSADLPKGTPAIVPSDGLDSYVVAWRANNFLRAAFLSPDVTASSAGFSIPTVAPCSGFPCPIFLAPSTTAKPALVPVPGARRVLVVAAMTGPFGGAATLGAYAIDSTVIGSETPWIGNISRTSDGAALSAAAVWSPGASRVLAAWDSAGPTRDVYVGDLAP